MTEMTKYRFALMPNAVYDRVEARARAAGVSLKACPTCGSKPFTVTREDEPAMGTAEGRVNGTYLYKGEIHPCDCELQMQLYAYYLAANIGQQYMRLDWNDFTNEDVKSAVASYLDKWPSAKRHGMGIEFGGPSLGVGKTFAATYVAKELIKRGQRVQFIPFLDFKRFVDQSIEDRDASSRERWDELREVGVLVLDEVRPPVSDAAAGVFSDRLEELVRNRTNHNLVTIVTTNLTSQELEGFYPRPYSLLRAKQVRIDMEGRDARASWIGEHNLDMMMNDEVPPIT